jgi:hypothetical protein
MGAVANWETTRGDSSMKMARFVIDTHVHGQRVAVNFQDREERPDYATLSKLMWTAEDADRADDDDEVVTYRNTDRLLFDMDTYGVDMVCLQPGFGFSNRLHEKMVEEHPDRFVAFAHPVETNRKAVAGEEEWDIDTACEELDEQLSKDAFVGIGEMLPFDPTIVQRAERTPEGGWVIAWNWDESTWQPREPLTQQDLDQVSQDHPIMARRVCGHKAVANQAALEALDLPAGTTGYDPDGKLFFYETEGENGHEILYLDRYSEDGSHDWKRIFGDWPTYGSGQKSHFHPRMTPDRNWILFVAGDDATETNQIFAVDVSDLDRTRNISGRA